MLEIDEAIKTRKTVKMLANPETPRPPSTNLRAKIDEVVALSGWAPFHKPCDRSHRDDTKIVEPWRYYMLDSAACRNLIPLVIEKAEKPGRIPHMLAGADAMIQVTWLPNPLQKEVPDMAGPDLVGSGEHPMPYAGSIANQEHIAAASAAIQTFLLAATARGLVTYWSSGGFLRSPEVFAALKIPAQEILLGSIYIFPDDYETEEWKPGGLRFQRSEPSRWANWVDV